MVESIIMKIVFLNGGLANQVFQYIFFRYAEINKPEEEWILDDSFFFVNSVHNGYELDKVFGLKPKLLSHAFDTDVWDYMIQLKTEQNKSIPQILMDNGTDISMMAETETWKKWNPFEGTVRILSDGKFDPKVITCPGEVYYHGYWIDKGWFRAIERKLRKELVFPEIDDPQNAEYMKQIESTESCSIHVRRGDFVELGVAASDDIYHDWIEEMMEHAPHMTLFVFSDDLDYCRTHMAEMGLDLPEKTVFIEGNRKDKAFRDMQLMSRCRYMIYANSSFSYLAALLNTNLNGFISQPNRRP